MPYWKARAALLAHALRYRDAPRRISTSRSSQLCRRPGVGTLLQEKCFGVSAESIVDLAYDLREFGVRRRDSCEISRRLPHARMALVTLPDPAARAFCKNSAQLLPPNPTGDLRRQPPRHQLPLPHPQAPPDPAREGDHRAAPQPPLSPSSLLLPPRHPAPPPLFSPRPPSAPRLNPPTRPPIIHLYALSPHK